MDNNELIKRVRVRANLIYHGELQHDILDLADALESAQKEIERLKMQCDINATSFFEMRNMEKEATARAEKAEAEIKSIHKSLNFADKSRSKCANYVELAVSNGLALGKIAVAIQHDYDAEPPEEGE